MSKPQHRRGARWCVLSLVVCAVALTGALASSGFAQPGPDNAAAAAATDALRYTYARSAGYRYALTLEDRSVLKLGDDKDIPTVSKLTTHLDVRPVKRDLKPGHLGVALVFGNLKADLTVNGASVDEGRFDQELGRTELNWTIDGRGQPQELIIGSTSPRREQLLRKLYDGFLRTLPVFPEGGAKVGQSWTRELRDDAKPPAGVPAISNHLKITSTVDAITEVEGRRVAKITSKLELTVTGQAGDGAAEVHVTQKTTGTSASVFDIELGVVRAHSISAKTVYAAKDPKGAPNGATQSDLTMTMTLTGEAKKR